MKEDLKIIDWEVISESKIKVKAMIEVGGAKIILTGILKEMKK